MALIKHNEKKQWNIMEIPEVDENKKGTEIIFKAIMAKNFPNMGREIDIQIQEAQKP